MATLSVLKCKAILFDLDGVITNTMPDHYRAWKEIFRREGMVVSRNDIYSREGQRGIHSLLEIFSAHGKVFTAQYGQKLLSEKEALFKKIFRQRFILGSRSLLKYLAAQNFLLALVTGTSRHELNKILPPAILNVFPCVVTGTDVTHGKPHPEPYLNALKGLNISPREAVVIENAPFGIRSAKAAGIRCLALQTSLPRSFLQEADDVFDSIKDLRQSIQFVRDR